jgi:hypothetical protein
MPQRVQVLRTSVKNQRPAPGTREPGEIFVSFADLQLGTINASKNAQDLIAVRFFSAATNYATGDFVIEAGKGYRAKAPIVAGAFNASQWDTITVSGDFEPPIAAGTTSQYWRGDKSWALLDKNAVGLSQVDNTSDANKPVSGATQTALNLKANLASPAFSGNPTAPTPAFPDNDTSIATTAFVSGNFAPIMDPFFGGNPQAPTPATADNDQSIATTAYVKANMVGLAPLASPTFTGDPKAPTPGPGDNDTSVATTAFVTNAVSTGLATIAPFPEAPIDGLTYGRKDAAWASVVGGAVVSDGAPAGPLQNGQLWWESDTGNTYIWYNDGNSSQWVQQNILPPPTTLPLTGIVRTVVLASGTYTKPNGLKLLEVTTIGAGGGGGGCATTIASQASAAGGGGGGGVSIKLYAASAIGATQAYTIGAAGTAGTLAAVGGTGGDTIFASQTGSGGGGGQPGGVTPFANCSFKDGGAGGAATGGDLNIPGGNGGQGKANMPAGNQIWPGHGGVSLLSLLKEVNQNAAAATLTGTTGIFPGGGGVGGGNTQALAGALGGAGADGCIILKEYF